MSDLSVSDALALGRENDGFGGANGGWFWIVILFLFASMGGNGFGWGNNGYRELLATSADVQRGFDTNTIVNKLDGLSKGLCDGFYAQNTTMLQGFGNVENSLAALGYKTQECCCETNRNIDAVRYENAKNTCDIITNATANTQKILDKLNESEINRLRTDLQSAQFQISQLSQASNIINNLRPTPIPAYITCSPYASLNNNCACNPGCVY